VYTGRGGTK